MGALTKPPRVVQTPQEQIHRARAQQVLTAERQNLYNTFRTREGAKLTALFEEYVRALALSYEAPRAAAARAPRHRHASPYLCRKSLSTFPTFTWNGHARQSLVCHARDDTPPRHTSAYDSTSYRREPAPCAASRMPAGLGGPPSGGGHSGVYWRRILVRVGWPLGDGGI
ncbi:hypothetical protein Sste5346_002272 [Sporothrix stenoceras]|uniref:Uncharacterized protein n=1 Tax=Sporothrix stenoceras TaxID=5173 RepID=A0ABR3ZJI0_9PEZI